MRFIARVLVCVWDATCIRCALHRRHSIYILNTTNAQGKTIRKHLHNDRQSERAMRSSLSLIKKGQTTHYQAVASEAQRPLCPSPCEPETTRRSLIHISPHNSQANRTLSFNALVILHWHRYCEVRYQAETRVWGIPRCSID